MKLIEYTARLVMATLWLVAAIIALPFAALDCLIDAVGAKWDA